LLKKTPLLFNSYLFQCEKLARTIDNEQLKLHQKFVEQLAIIVFAVF
jgi:hypothetical protein